MKLPALVLISCVALAQDAIRVGQLVSGELDGAKACIRDQLCAR